MKKVSMFLFAVIWLSVLVSCSQENNTEEMPEMVEVALQLPETGKINEQITVSAIVTQGDEVVDDADEVLFEVWEEGSKEESKMYETTSQEDGTYETLVSFDHDGVYIVQVHVSARRMHVMPKKQIIIGNAVPHEGESAQESSNQEEHDHH